jgi:hypothetical protein
VKRILVPVAIAVGVVGVIELGLLVTPWTGRTHEKLTLVEKHQALFRRLTPGNAEAKDTAVAETGNWSPYPGAETGQEAKIETLEDRIEALEARIADLEKQIARLNNRLDYVGEGRRIQEGLRSMFPEENIPELAPLIPSYGE